MNTLLAAIDIANTHSGFLAYIETLARQLNAKVWLVHVAQPHPDVIEIGLSNVADWERRTINSEHQPLLDMARQMGEMGIDATPLLLQGPVVESLLEVARDVAASMILVNSQGHGPLYDLVVGSVAEGLSGNAVCPVLWVPKAWVDR